jgi:sensor histidine kinase YesM
VQQRTVSVAMLKNTSINTKLLVAASVTLTCTVLISVWSVLQFEKLYVETKNFDDYWLPSVHAANDMQRAALLLHTTLMENEASANERASEHRGKGKGKGKDKDKGNDENKGNNENKDSDQQSLRALAVMEQQYKRYAKTPEEQEIFEQFRTALREYIVEYKRVRTMQDSISRLGESRATQQNAKQQGATQQGARQQGARQQGARQQGTVPARLTLAKRAFSQMLESSNHLVDYNARHTDTVASETLRHFLHSQLFVTVGLVAAIFVSLIVNWLIAWSIVRRLRLIQFAAERISYGNLHVPIETEQLDEIGHITRAFNDMTENLRATLNNLADEQVRERQAQLEALQAQLAPHFLFNSLTALGGLIMNNKPHAIEFLEKLSYTYRYVLMHRQQHLVTVEDELHFAQAYTFLASIRFREGFDLRMTVPDEFLQYKLPCMTLQLLLENAVKHNIVSAQQPLRITLEIGYYDHEHPIDEDDKQSCEHLQHSAKLIVRNNVQHRTMSIGDLMTISPIAHQTSSVDSTKVGLQNLKHRYRLLTNQTPEIIETNEQFTVVLPLLAPEYAPSEHIPQDIMEPKFVRAPSTSIRHSQYGKATFS